MATKSVRAFSSACRLLKFLSSQIPGIALDPIHPLIESPRRTLIPIAGNEIHEASNGKRAQLLRGRVTSGSPESTVATHRAFLRGVVTARSGPARITSGRSRLFSARRPASNRVDEAPDVGFMVIGDLVRQLAYHSAISVVSSRFMRPAARSSCTKRANARGVCTLRSALIGDELRSRCESSQ